VACNRLYPMGIEKKAEKSGIAQHGGKESEMKRRKEKEKKKIGVLHNKDQ